MTDPVKLFDSAKTENQLLNLLVNHYFGSMLITDSHGNFIYVNDGCCRLLGLDRDTLLNISIYDTLHDYCHASSASTIKTLESRNECLSSHTIGSNNKNILALSRPYFDADGNLEYVFTYSWDEYELYTLLEKFDKERNNVRNVIQFIQNINNVSSNLIAASPIMLNLMNYSENIAKVDSTIIIYGESGCGKELFAKYIHSKSLRASEVFIPINCASLPPTLLEAELFGYEKGTFTGGDKNGKIGIFEFANRGTIFLDEIGEMPLELQAKLLRIIESGEIKRLGSNKLIKSDVRIIAATNRNLYEMVQEKTFRADLYYRLNVLVINVPPLRERHEDIKPLAQHFVNTFNKKFGFTKILSSELIERMESYPWPGNVRELKNIVERMMVSTQSNIIDKASFNVGDTASPTASKNSDSLPEYELPYQDAVAAFEKRYLEHTLASCENDVRRAARKTNLHLSTLYRKIKEHQL